ncbi:MAG TPA: alkaline phosphatase family protein [bacterium]|nr:alkaline phosphatase family protein [bacterium]
MTSSARRKVLILGLDGATWDVLGPLARDGTMPNLAGFLERGVCSELASQIPPVTATAWSSFVTGLNPGKHGVFEFLLRRRGISEKLVSARNPFGEVPVNSTLRDGVPMWELASRAGLKSVVIGVPITYPPRQINGYMISDFLTPYGKRDFTWPPSLLDDLEARFGPYKLYHREVYSRRGVNRVIDELFDVLKFNIAVTRHLARSVDWDLFISHFWGTDRAQHELWHILDEHHPRHDAKEAAVCAPRLKQFYALLDQGLGEIIKDAGKAEVILASDHGFGPIHTFLAFNIWLLERGYLKLKRDPATLAKRLGYSLGLTPVLFYRLSMALGLARLRLSGGFHSRQRMQMLLNRFFLSLDNVDWARTRAYSRGNYGQIYVNLRGREPWGSVSPGEEYNEVRASIKRDLVASREPFSGDPLFDKVWLREEIYDGPYVEEAADIVFLPRDMRYKALGTLDFTSSRFAFPVYGNSGDHRMNGIFVGLGNEFRRGAKLDKAALVDIAPTVLYLLGLPVPRQMDGRVLAEAIREEYLNGHPVGYVDTELIGQVGGHALTSQDSEDIKRRLEGIGYIG